MVSRIVLDKEILLIELLNSILNFRMAKKF